jgi:hypothetical protein
VFICVDVRIIVKRVLQEREDVDWIRMAQDMVQWRTPLNMVKNVNSVFLVETLYSPLKNTPRKILA